MVIGQKRKHSIIKIRLVTLVSKCRRLVYLLFSSNVVQVAPCTKYCHQYISF